MFDERRMEEAREMLISRYWGDESIEHIIPILGKLLCYCNIEKIAPIITELLHDDPLVDRISKIYEQGDTLWFTLQNNLSGNEE